MRMPPNTNKNITQNNAKGVNVHASPLRCRAFRANQCFSVKMRATGIDLVALCEKCLVTWQRRRSVSSGLDRGEGIDKEERFGAFACQFVNSLLQLRYHLRVLLSQIGIFTGILRDVVELQSGRQRRAPDQFQSGDTRRKFHSQDRSTAKRKIALNQASLQ